MGPSSPALPVAKRAPPTRPLALGAAGRRRGRGRPLLRRPCPPSVDVAPLSVAPRALTIAALMRAAERPEGLA